MDKADFVISQFMDDWRSPEEIAGEVEELNVGDVKQLLERNGIQASPIFGEDPATVEQSETDYFNEGRIDGKYVADDEPPALEDYVDGLVNDLNTDEIAEVVNTLYDKEVVSSEEVGDYLMEREGAEYTRPGKFRLRPSDEDDQLRVYGLKDVLSSYHEDFDNVVKEVKKDGIQSQV